MNRAIGIGQGRCNGIGMSLSSHLNGFLIAKNTIGYNSQLSPKLGWSKS
jgi:hypothetical protein